VREKLFRFTGDELPYTSTVVIDKFEEEPSKQHKRMVRIAATIVVERDGHKAMVIGDKGERLKRIGTEARRSWKSCWMPRCSWSCGSRCALAGPTTKPACAPSATSITPLRLCARAVGKARQGTPLAVAWALRAWHWRCAGAVAGAALRSEN
jgi:hypothetical protein